MTSTTAGTAPMSLVALSRLSPGALEKALRSDAAHTARWLYDAACQGLVEAQTTLGQALLDGRGTPADAAAARRWFGRAAEAGHAPAANMLGRCLERGWGGDVDHAAAATCYRQAAEAGLDWGQYNLANMLLRGRGLARDVTASYRWFAAAAEQGHAKSINLVGRFLEEGWIGPPDPMVAATWYLRAAQGGDFRGQYNLAILLAQTGHTDDAVIWFTRAGESGSLDFRRVAAEQLLQHADLTLRAVGLMIAERCCKDGGGEDYHRYGSALIEARQPRVAQVWLRMAVAAGCAAAQAELAALETANAASGRRRLGRFRRREKTDFL